MLVKVQWKKPGEFALLDEKDLDTRCPFAEDGKWKLFTETPIVPEEIFAEPVVPEIDKVELKRKRGKRRGSDGNNEQVQD